MKTKTLAQVDGFIGIIAGAIFSFLTNFLWYFLQPFSEDEDAAGLILGIISLFLFSENCNPHSWNPLTCLL